MSKWAVCPEDKQTRDFNRVYVLTRALGPDRTRTSQPSYSAIPSLEKRFLGSFLNFLKFISEQWLLILGPLKLLPA